MAIIATLPTGFGEDRACYVRLNNVEVSNHGEKARALFRAFLSRESFETGGRFVDEYLIEFDADVSRAIWPQAYRALKAYSPHPDADANEALRADEELGAEHQRKLARNASFEAGLKHAKKA